jgi:hypothetical protein
MRLRRWWILLILAGLCFRPSGAAQAAVVISSFTAEADNTQVILRWETASEMDVSGFYLQRSTQVDGSFTRVSNFFLSMGDGVTGYQYQYIDTGLTNEVTYYYQLEVLDVNQVSEFYGPISAAPGVPGPTSTPTPLPATRTQTPTQAQTAGVTPQNGSPTSTVDGLTASPVVGQLTPTFDQLTPEPSPQSASHTPMEPTSMGDPVLNKPTMASGPASATSQSSGTPLDEQQSGSIFDSDILLWIGALLGGLALGVILALVLWSLTRRTKAG